MTSDAALDVWLARQARLYALDATTVEDADPDVLRAYCRDVLQELAARGLLPGPHEIGCHAAPRDHRN
ncbi:hypothetical protein [Deinococcus aquiradiocola]|uniref:Uncharacterized protein n=1 Tax=Deinococcus aquiradiocola TaxID=393059 RepID=A0A917PNZ3_9DEIO|nr:hypothetical protein [Deinococcus aquiradiocola]GGJ85885.1 hypothetical protein GCM10008939_32200 [Deinococcus aquiradiocola]